jgi:penicillin amidase
MIGKIALIFAAVIILLVAAGLGGYWWLLPKYSGSVTVAGLNNQVEIVRDDNAVPHIYAENAADAYFALGYVHAQDRLWQMEFTRRAGAGRLAEVLGETALESDLYLRTLGLYRLAEAMFETASPEVRAALEAYAAGVNGWLATRSGALPPEFILLGIDPEDWQPADSLIWSRLMALRLGRNQRNEHLRACIAQELAARKLSPKLLDELWPEDPPGAPITLADATLGTGPVLDAMWSAFVTPLAADSGSNGWIVHGHLTETGKPILANDPHLRFGAPILWYLARIEAPGLTLTGVTAPGVPFTIFGHNGSIAWGFTNSGGDVEDLFLETVDLDEPRNYLTPDGPRPFVTRREVIRVKSEKTVVITVRETRHGPVISDVRKDAACVADDSLVVALATPALLSDDRTIEALFAINRAQNWKNFHTAAAKSHTPQLNFFFAFIAPGRIPIRKAGDGRMPEPGADGEFDWDGFIPVEELPQAHNPPLGRIVNANNQIAGDGYPYLITRDWALPYRAERITEVLEGQARHGVGDSQDLQRDILSTPARRLLPLMLRVTPTSEHSRKAVKLLSEWDFEMRREHPEALLYTAWLRQIVIALAKDELGEALLADYVRLVFRPDPRFVETVLTRHHHWCDDIDTSKVETCEEQLAVALDQALDKITTALGPDIESWRWGDLHRATFSHRVFTHVPVLQWLADLSIESDGGDHTVNRGSTRRDRSPDNFSHTDGSGFRAVYDLSDLYNSHFMIATGQSGNFLSRHYSDLLEPWRDGRYIQISGQRDEIAGTAIGTLSLQPASP